MTLLTAHRAFQSALIEAAFMASLANVHIMRAWQCTGEARARELREAAWHSAKASAEYANAIGFASV